MRISLKPVRAKRTYFKCGVRGFGFYAVTQGLSLGSWFVRLQDFDLDLRLMNPPMMLRVKHDISTSVDKAIIDED